MLCQFTEQEFQIVVNLEPIGFSGLDDAVEYSPCFGTKNGIRADPVLPAYGKWPDKLPRVLKVSKMDAEFHFMEKPSSLQKCNVWKYKQPKLPIQGRQPSV